MSCAPALPEGLLISWYGDDFTGSSAVMEVLSLAGLPSVLFFDPPTSTLLEKFKGYRGMGIAGVARSKSPAWMEKELPPVFDVLTRLQAPITHYKVCSTLDSSPHVGSIGKAIELADRYFDSRWVPILIAAPTFHRYQVFGNLFAGVDGVSYRLDRHPSVSRHPVTPMTESDVRLHLAQQTRQAMGLIDLLALREGRAETQLSSELAAGRRLVVIDSLDEDSLIEAGRLIWEQRDRGRFAVGSQGIEYALAAYWRSRGMIPCDPAVYRAERVDQIVIVSGSCSRVTAGQIDWAAAHGYETIRLDPCCALDQRAWKRELSRATDEALVTVGRGRDPIVFTARGPDDKAVPAYHTAIESAGADPIVINERVGTGLGTILDDVLKRSGLRRGIFAGGDTSGHGAKVLGVQALTLLAPTTPGAALCRAHSDDPHYADLEIALKGGQMGVPDYFGQIKDGGIH